MRVLFALYFIMIIAGCCNTDALPEGPYGNPDDILIHDFSPNERLVIYSYYCVNGRSISVEFKRNSPCDDFFILQETEVEGLGCKENPLMIIKDSTEMIINENTKL